MATIPENIRVLIRQRQQQRTRCAQIIGALLEDHRLANMAGPIVQAGIALLHEDQCDLNGTPGVKNAIEAERNAWQRLQRAGDGPITSETLRQINEDIETIKRVINVQSTLIDLAIPEPRRPLQDLYDEYQQRYGKPPCD